MTFSALLRTLRDRWILLVAGVVIGTVAGAAVTLLMPNTYRASTSLYVSAFDNSQSATSAYQGGLLSQQRIKSYSELMVSTRVLGPVVDRLSPGSTTDTLAKQVSVSSTTDSTILVVAVDDRDPRRAADLANAIADRFIVVVSELERPRAPNAVPAVTVSVVDQAALPTRPVSPVWATNLVVGLVVGLVGSAALALIRGSLDSTVRTSAELAKITRVASLGSLPIAATLAAGGSPSSVDDAGYAEAVRRVRTNLLFADVDDPPRTVAVTSSVPSEGKTTLVCALAAALAPTTRVAVIEGDLRRPTIATRLGLVDSVGLSEVLTRRAPLGSAVQRWNGVDVLVCGSIPPNPSELLSSRQMGEVVAALAADHDLVLIDGPPLVPVADGAILASRADGALLLCRAGVTTSSELETAVQALDAVGARLYGSVFSLVPPSRSGGGENGYYGYAAAPPGTPSGNLASFGPGGAAPPRPVVPHQEAAAQRSSGSPSVPGPPSAQGLPSAQGSPVNGRAVVGSDDDLPTGTVPVSPPHRNGWHPAEAVTRGRHAQGPDTGST